MTERQYDRSIDFYNRNAQKSLDAQTQLSLLTRQNQNKVQAPDMAIGNAIQSLQLAMTQNNQNDIEGAFGRLTALVKQQNPGMSDQEAAGKAQAYYTQYSGANLHESLVANGTSPFWYGVMDTGILKFFPGNNVSAGENAARIAGGTVSPHEKTMESVGNAAGWVVQGALALAAAKYTHGKIFKAAKPLEEGAKPSLLSRLWPFGKKAKAERIEPQVGDPTPPVTT